MSEGGNDFKFGLFGCLGDFKLCIITYIVPCYTIGKNAEALGEDCLTIGLLAAVGLPFESILRWRIRTERNIKGSMLYDVIIANFCFCCSAIQEARELGWWNGGPTIGKAEPQTMNRE